MILIADSGSTKTDWKILSENEVFHYNTRGLNPFFMDLIEIVKVLRGFIRENFIDVNRIQEIHFYGAGCKAQEMKNRMRKGFLSVFKNSIVYIETDMLGAARALCGTTPGIVCILGTGSNSCYYDGSKIVDTAPSLGYVFGDEGGGVYLGKILLENYLKGILPDKLSFLFEKEYEDTRVDMLNAVYNEPYPNKYIASYSTFFSKYPNDLFLRKILYRAFDSFFDYFVKRYDSCYDVEVSFTGSIAFVFKDIINEIAKENNRIVKRVVKSPIEGLIKFHMNYL